MTLPGFSAEASFFRSNGYYQPGVVLASLRQQGEVIPQRPPIYALCYPAEGRCCIFYRVGSYSEGTGGWAFECFPRE
jgi:hypothetical protein